MFDMKFTDHEGNQQKTMIGNQQKTMIKNEWEETTPWSNQYEQVFTYEEKSYLLSMSPSLYLKMDDIIVSGAGAEMAQDRRR